MGEPMNSPLKYLQTQSGKTTSLAFEVLSCISLQAVIPSKPSVLPVAHCPLAEGLASEKMKTSNAGYFPWISPSPRCLRCNLILLHCGDKSTCNPYFLLSEQSEHQNIIWAVTFTGRECYRRVEAWASLGGWEDSVLLPEAPIHGHG